MTATAKTTTEDTAERIKDLNEQVLELGRKAGVSFLDAYETTLKTVADFTRDASKVYTATARELLVK